MKIRLTESQIRYLSKPIPTAEHVSDWVWWVIVVICLSTIIFTCFKIWELYNIQY